MKKALIRILSVLVLAVLGLIIFVMASWDKAYDDTPMPEFKASTDPDVIARGKYLAFGPAHCGTCHVPMDKIMEVEDGLEIPLSGGWELDIPPGVFRAPNLTPDKETGIGDWADGQIARAIRHSVKHDGMPLMPFMPFQEMSDADITAIISFLRSQESVVNAVPPTEYTFLGKALLAFGMLKPQGPEKTPPKAVEVAPTVEYGSYLANSVANCRGCHTKRDLKTGDYIGSDFAGGMAFPQEVFSQGHSFVSPNITPDSETGRITEWVEEAFVGRFKGGRVQVGTPMPWGAFSRIDTVGLQAIYRYLMTLKPINNQVKKTVYTPGEEIPEELK